jgi:ERCC4-type nuclease
MRIIIDDREHSLYEKMLESNKNTSIILSRETLHLGDVHIKTDDLKDVVLIERKSLSDLLSSIKDGRYEEQSHRLSNASGVHPHNIIYIIEGIISQIRIPRERQIILSAITSLNFFKGFSVLRTSSVQETAELILAMTDKINRDFIKGKLPYNYTSISEIPLELTENIAEDGSQTPTPIQYANFVKKVKRDNITPNNIGEILLSQIPGVSPVTAAAILLKYDNSFLKFIEESSKNKEDLFAILGKITYESKKGPRKINKSAIENIAQYIFAVNK